MAKRDPKSGVSHLSPRSLDKLMAALNFGVNVGSAAYMQNPDYFAACARWHADLTPDQSETVQVVIDAYTHTLHKAR